MCLVAAVLAALGLARLEAQTIPLVDAAKLPRFEVVSVKPGDPECHSCTNRQSARFSQENADLSARS
jgi:hypothetical protein